MEKHQNDEHIQGRVYKCDICDFQESDENKLKLHKSKDHVQSKVTVDKSYIDSILEENNKLKKENENLKDDFERLTDIFENTRNNSQDDSRNNNVELNKVREEYRIIKTENEFLKEKNDTLFKLGKIALDKNNNVTETEVIEDEDENGLDTLVRSSLENRANKFTRRDPASYAERSKAKEVPNPTTAPKTSQDNESSSRTKTTEANGAPKAPQDPVSPAAPRAPQDPVSPAVPRAPQDPVSPPGTRAPPGASSSLPTSVENQRNRISYCHFFSNYGRCHFEEETGRKCKFSHIKAPVCSYNGHCDRKKCMFSNTKRNNDVHRGQNPSNQNNPNHFLAKNFPNGPPNPLQQQMNFLMQQMQQMTNQQMWENVGVWH